jgi:AraC family transcriptional regulator
MAMQNALTKASRGGRLKLCPSPVWLSAGLVSFLVMGCNPDRRVNADIERAPQKLNEAMKQPDIIHRGRFLVMGTVTRRKSGPERPEAFTAIWSAFEAHHEKIKHHSVDSKYYGVSFGAAQDGGFDYLAGMAVTPVEQVPEGLQVCEVPAATYAVFACPVQAIGQTYGYIHGEWRSATGYELDATKPAFEQYPPAAETNAPVLIHVPIRENQLRPRPGQQDGAGNGSQPLRSETNRTSSAADSRR